MKLILAFTLFTTFLFAQLDTTFVGLKGFEDSTGTTHLFYTTKSSKLSIYDSARELYVDSTNYFYKVLNTQGNTINLITKGFHNNYVAEDHRPWSLVDDIEFFDNDPSRYIYIINSIGIDLDGRIARYDRNYLAGVLGHFKDIYISPKGSNHIYAVGGSWITQSSDSGLTWNDFSITIQKQPYIHYLTFSQFDESVVYGYNNKNNLVKSVDTGKTFIEVSNLGGWNRESKLFFDKDYKHIYSVTNQYLKDNYDSKINANIAISDNNGESNSWQQFIYNGERLDLCIDDSISGNLYLSIGNEINRSSDFGKTFNNFIELQNHANGIYKKPKQELYVITPNKLLIIAGDSTITLISNSIEKSLNFYPIAVGNKWFYNENGITYTVEPEPINRNFYVEITMDTIYQGQHFFLVEGDNTNKKYWIRMDSLTGKIYQKTDINNDEERLFYDLIASEGDNGITEHGIIDHVFANDTLIWNEYRHSKVYKFLSLYTQEITFVQNIGITRKYNSFDFGNTSISLLGCVINGKLFGDTTVVGIQKNPLDIPNTFSLSQNYPNPFNPTTTIEYIIPLSEKRETLSTGRQAKNVKITVYDVLGKKVATLLNEIQSPGKHKIVFDASNLSSGIYYYSLSINGQVTSKKMILLK